jgi:hypothetical protein
VLRSALGGENFSGLPATFELDGGIARPGGSFSAAAAGELLRTWVEDLDPSAAPAAAGSEAALAL